jgi:hypothetical protein
MKKLLSLLLCLHLLILPALAQNESAGGGDDFLKNTQQDIFIVAGAAGAGAILGLSTLSFTEEPAKHLRNIWTGAALGMIAGVIFVAYNSAQRGSEELQQEASRDFSTSDRATWHLAKAPVLSPPQVQFSTPIWHMSF